MAASHHANSKSKSKRKRSNRRNSSSESIPKNFEKEKSTETKSTEFFNRFFEASFINLFRTSFEQLSKTSFEHLKTTLKQIVKKSVSEYLSSWKSTKKHSFGAQEKRKNVSVQEDKHFSKSKSNSNFDDNLVRGVGLKKLNLTKDEKKQENLKKIVRYFGKSYSFGTATCEDDQGTIYEITCRTINSKPKEYNLSDEDVKKDSSIIRSYFYGCCNDESYENCDRSNPENSNGAQRLLNAINSPNITLSRGKTNARKEQKQKIFGNLESPSSGKNVSESKHFSNSAKEIVNDNKTLTEYYDQYADKAIQMLNGLINRWDNVTSNSECVRALISEAKEDAHTLMYTTIQERKNSFRFFCKNDKDLKCMYELMLTDLKPCFLKFEKLERMKNFTQENESLLENNDSGLVNLGSDLLNSVKLSSEETNSTENANNNDSEEEKLTQIVIEEISSSQQQNLESKEPLKTDQSTKTNDSTSDATLSERSPKSILKRADKISPPRKSYSVNFIAESKIYLKSDKSTSNCKQIISENNNDYQNVGVKRISRKKMMKEKKRAERTK